MGQNGRSGLLVRLTLGHSSTILPKGHPAGHTHRWTVFVMSHHKEHFKDRQFVDKVCFTLHPDFTNPKRLVKEPPFQVTETGYAGFQIPLEIWLACGKKYKVQYDLNLTMEPEAVYTISTSFEVKDYTPEFYSIAKRFGAEKQKRARENDTLVLPSIAGPSSISPPPEKIRKKERSADVSARNSPVPPVDRLKIRAEERGDRDSKKGESSISPPIRGGEMRRREESTPMPPLPTPTPPPPPKEKKKKENKRLDFVLDRSSAASSARPSPSASPALMEKKLLMRKEEKRKDVSSSASPSTSTAVERLKKEERKREKASSPSTVSEKEKKKEKNGFTPSPPEKEKRKEKDADRLPGLSPPEKERQKERKERRDKDDDRFGGAPSEKKKAEKERGREKEEKEQPSLAELAIKRTMENEREAEKEKEQRRKRKERERLREQHSSRPSSAADREKKEEKEKERRPLPAITPPPVLLRQELAPSAAMVAAMAAAAASVSPPTLVPINNSNGRAPPSQPPPPSSHYSYGGTGSAGGVVLPSLLTSNFMPYPMQQHLLAGSSSSQGGQGVQGGGAAGLSHHLQQPSPSGSLGGRETPSEKASRSSISPGLRNEETASSGGSSASSHSSERREQKRIPKLASSLREREAMSAPLASVDASTVRRKIESLTDPEKVFEVALLLLDLDDTSHISIGGKNGTTPSLSYDLAGLDQMDLLRLDSLLNGS